jgi:ATP-dependent DNA helicase RecG
MSINIRIDSPIEYLKGVGPIKGALLKKHLNVNVVSDLLNYFPFRYVDKSAFSKIKDIYINTEYILLKCKISSISEEGQGRQKRLVALAEDETGIVELIWFQGGSWLMQLLQVGQEYIIYGKVNFVKNRISIAHPELDMIRDPSNIKAQLGYQAIYSSTEGLNAKGLGSKGIAQVIQNLFQYIHHSQIDEILPQYIIDKFQLIPRYDAFKKIHLPKSESDIVCAKNRLKFDELFAIQMKMFLSKIKRQRQSKGYLFVQLGDHFNDFYKNHMPFPLTSAQQRVIKEIHQDMHSSYQMNRLLQGDVGSGKTIVSFLIMLIAIGNGYQACIMAPTEVLATQHYQTISGYCEKIGLKTCLLTSQVKSKVRQNILNELASGEIHIAIGTHALIEDPIVFNNLGLCVVDEQHRFGVEQRAKLWKKAKNGNPHVLVMTATPIPRTLAMTLYGDLDVSIIDELPPNRKEIKTMHLKDIQRMQLYNFMKEQIEQGRQIYFVFPLIAESEKLDIENLTLGYEKLLQYFPLPKYRVSIVHGKMKSASKESEMKLFVSGSSNIMVATTVIEVGVNVPNASVMVIENAERFGLSQLHQLRGRVGRGADQSYCVLMTGNKVSIDALKRIETMVATNDGFKIAEADLEMRGPGDLDGTKQSGLIQLNIADIQEDNRILVAARNLAEAILNKDPDLSNPLNIRLRNQYIDEEDNSWAKIG